MQSQRRSRDYLLYWNARLLDGVLAFLFRFFLCVCVFVCLFCFVVFIGFLLACFDFVFWFFVGGGFLGFFCHFHLSVKC